MEVTTARILDNRRMLKKTGTYPLAIRVTYNRTPVRFPIGLYLSKEDFQKLSSPRLGERLIKIKNQFEEEEKRAINIIRSLGTFTFPAFRKEFYKDSQPERNKPGKNPQKDKQVDHAQNNSQLSPQSTVKTKKYGSGKFDRVRTNIDFKPLGPLALAFGEYIKKLEAQERIGTSEAYFFALMSLLAFQPKLRLEDISEDFLYQYERWMLSRGKSITSIGIYLRSLRAIINLPKNKKLFTNETYPFGRGKYQIPTGRNIKKALGLAEIKKIYDYTQQTELENEMFARDMWLFGYFANGINPKDIACLKYENIIDSEYIVITREKTRRTTRSNPKIIVIHINPDMARIINKWGNKDKSAMNYIFPVLSNGITVHRKRVLIQGFISVINDWMKRIGKSLGINKPIRTMEYRHSMATVLKRSGVSTEFIKEALGHTDLKTTENYLDSFELDVKKDMAKHLLSFKALNTAAPA